MFQKSYHTVDLSKYSFLVTGGAGFVGSNIVEYLLKYGAGKVRVIDNLITGFKANILKYKEFPNFEFIEGDIKDDTILTSLFDNIDYVLHQAALGSVPRSIENPIPTNEANITGFIKILFYAKQANVKRIVYASSSSVYGDNTQLPKKEEYIGKPLSPYGVTKIADELYADVFAKTYNMEIIGLRYFNIFGPKQNPKGPYAAVIPLFIEALLNNKQPNIYGDGEQLRDFTFVENAVQANIKAVFTENKEALNQIFNIAYGSCVSVNELFNTIKKHTDSELQPNYLPPRKGDIVKSYADISKAGRMLNYKPEINIEEGLKKTLKWYKENIKAFQTS